MGLRTRDLGPIWTGLRPIPNRRHPPIHQVGTIGGTHLSGGEREIGGSTIGGTHLSGGEREIGGSGAGGTGDRGEEWGCGRGIGGNLDRVAVDLAGESAAANMAQCWSSGEVRGGALAMAPWRIGGEGDRQGRIAGWR